jgi:hypothetical protein
MATISSVPSKPATPPETKPTGKPFSIEQVQTKGEEGEITLDVQHGDVPSYFMVPLAQATENGDNPLDKITFNVPYDFQNEEFTVNLVADFLMRNNFLAKGGTLEFLGAVPLTSPSSRPGTYNNEGIATDSETAVTYGTPQQEVQRAASVNNYTIIAGPNTYTPQR